MMKKLYPLPMVQLSDTRSFRRTRQATVNWLTRASVAALKTREEGQTQWTLDNVLESDPEHENWWISPTQPNIGPLFHRELSETQPRWLNAANRAGFYAGLKNWNWNRTDLGEMLPDHYFTVRYELDRDNNNQYVKTVLEAHQGMEPSTEIFPPRETSNVSSTVNKQTSGRGGRGGETGRGRGRETGRGETGRGRGGETGRGRGGETGRGRGGETGRGETGRGRVRETGRGRGRGGPYRPAEVVATDSIQVVDDSNSWAARLKSDVAVKTVRISDHPLE